MKCPKSLKGDIWPFPTVVAVIHSLWILQTLFPRAPWAYQELFIFISGQEVITFLSTSLMSVEFSNFPLKSPLVYASSVTQYLLAYIHLYIGQWSNLVNIGHWPKNVHLCLGVNQLKNKQVDAIFYPFICKDRHGKMLINTELTPHSLRRQWANRFFL